MNLDNKYSEIEKQIDAILSDGRLHLLPPGFWTFVSVNMLLILGSAMLILVAIDVIFADQLSQAPVFFFVSSVVLTFVIVTPAFLVMRGRRKALDALKYIVIILIIALVLFGVVSEFTNDKLNIVIIVSLASLSTSLWLLNSPSYQLLSLFTARRRELALEDMAKKQQIINNKRSRKSSR